MGGPFKPPDSPVSEDKEGAFHTRKASTPSVGLPNPNICRGRFEYQTGCGGNLPKCPIRFPFQ